MSVMTNEEIFAKSKIWAARFVSHLNCARHLVEELGQEAAIGMLRAREKYQPSKGPFEPYARLWANALMKKHLNALGGAVRASTANKDTKMPESMGLSVEIEERGDTHWRDDRKYDSFAFEHAAFKESLADVDARTALMVEAKAGGATNEEIADALGMSRESVRKRVLAFVKDLSA